MQKNMLAFQRSFGMSHLSEERDATRACAVTPLCHTTRHLTLSETAVVGRLRHATVRHATAGHARASFLDVHLPLGALLVSKLASRLAGNVAPTWRVTPLLFGGAETLTLSASVLR